MTTEQKRIKIAEACGWFRVKYGFGWANRTDPSTHCEPPDYFNDLNACHEMEKVMNTEQRENYIALLANMAGMRRTKATINSDYYIVATATAAQRAEAFGLTLGLWKEGE